MSFRRRRRSGWHGRFEAGEKSHEQSRCALKGRHVEVLPPLRSLGETTPVVVLQVWLADESVTTRKLADTDTQVQALRRNTGKACVSIASSLDTLPPASVPSEMRGRWLRALRQAARAVALVEERLAAAPEATR